MAQDYTKYNAITVLDNVERLIEWGGSYVIREVYDSLSIFDWWPRMLNQSHLKQMRTFLKEAIKLGYTGYVCFKVGAHGCANGMWAYKVATTDGYSPDGDAIYRSFTPDYTYYSINHNNHWLPSNEIDGNAYNSLKTTRDLEKYITNLM